MRGGQLGIPALQVNDNFLSSTAIVTTQLLRPSIAGQDFYYGLGNTQLLFLVVVILMTRLSFAREGERAFLL